MEPSPQTVSSILMVMQNACGALEISAHASVLEPEKIRFDGIGEELLTKVELRKV
jgi:ABC-type branched-subunit amino acid transport system ATPase component